MKAIFAILCCAAVAAAGAAGRKPAQPAARTAAAPAKAAAQPAAQAAGSDRLQIPAGAVEAEPGLFHSTDAAGHKWVYHPTPFGVSRWEEGASASAPAAPGAAPEMKAFEEGDSVRFERHTPFGVSVWRQKKTELNDKERAVWERRQGPVAGQD